MVSLKNKEEKKENEKIKIKITVPLDEKLIKKSKEEEWRHLDSENRRYIAVTLYYNPDPKTIDFMLEIVRNETNRDIRILLLETLVFNFKEKKAAPIVARRLDEIAKNIDNLDMTELIYLLKFAEILKERIFLRSLTEILNKTTRWGALNHIEKYREIYNITTPVFGIIFEKALKEEGIEAIVYGDYNY